MRIFGLTGGIASGKSTVSWMLRELGAHVLDADVIAREVVAPGTPGLAAIAEHFGDVLAPDGSLDRKALGARIFDSPAERAALEAITHPRIRQAFLEQSWALAESGVTELFYDAALLIENRLHEGMDAVVVVWVPREVQLARLMARDSLTLPQAQSRLAAQLPLEEKRRLATDVIDNSGSREQTRLQVEALWSRLREVPPGGA